jgi:hypothetical protein
LHERHLSEEAWHCPAGAAKKAKAFAGTVIAFYQFVAFGALLNPARKATIEAS